MPKAKKYLESGNYLWNSGMFVWKSSVILNNFRRFLPRLYRNIDKIEPFLGTPEEEKAVEDIYPILPVSIDYGVMERSDEVVVIPGILVGMMSDAGIL